MSASVAKVAEITSISDISFQDAVESGIARASKTIRNVKSAWVQDQEVIVEGGKVTGYKVAMKLTFLLE